MLAEQARQFDQPIHLGQRVIGLEQEDGHFVLVTDKERFPSRSILIAAGIGAFSPRRLPQACAEPWYGRGIHDIVTDPEMFRGQRVVIIGGGDSAFDWGTQLLDRAERVTIVHRSDRFRAHGATVAQFQAAVEAGRAGLFTFHELARHQVRRWLRPFHAHRGSRREGEDDSRDRRRRRAADARLRERHRAARRVGADAREGRDRRQQHDGDRASGDLRGRRRRRRIRESSS